MCCRSKKGAPLKRSSDWGGCRGQRSQARFERMLLEVCCEPAALLLLEQLRDASVIVNPVES